MRGIRIFQYHSIDESGSLVSTTPSDFRKQLAHLKKRGYRAISASNFINEYHDNSVKGSKKVALITFDDGFRNNYAQAFPILKEYGFTATIFLVTDYIDKKALWIKKFLNRIVPRLDLLFAEGAKEIGHNHLNLQFTSSRLPFLLSFTQRQLSREIFALYKVSEFPLMSWNEIREMSNYGISFGAHTCSHPFLSDLGIEEAKDEIYQSKMVIEENLNKPVTLFSYPYNDFAPPIKQLVKNLGFQGAFSERPSLNNWHHDLYELGRIGIGSKTTPRFKFYLSGGFDWYVYFKKLLSKGNKKKEGR